MHPSFLELDRHAHGAGRDEVTAHVAACEVCRAHVAEVAAADDVPAWARALGPRRHFRIAWRTLRLRPLGFAVAALTCLAIVWTVVRSDEVERAQGRIGTKGDPIVEIYVKHGNRVTVWNGSDPISPGDLLRVKLQPDRFAHVSVFALREAPALYDRVYDAAIAPARVAALPFSLRADDRGTMETLIVVLGPGSVDATALEALLASRGDAQHWLRRLVLRKGPGGSDP